MTLDGFLTVLGLAAAIYAVVPAVSRLRIQLGMAIQAPVAVGALVLVLYLQFFELVKQPCLLPWEAACAVITIPADGGLRPPQAAFLVVLAWMTLAWAIHKFTRPGVGSLAAMERLVETLVYERRFAELMALSEPYLPLLDAVAGRRLRVQKLADQCARWRAAYTGRTAWHRLPAMVGWLGVWLPRHNKASERAEDIVRTLLNSQELLRFVVEMRPYAGLAMLRLSAERSEDFSDRFLTGLIAHRGSALYQELKQNQDQSGLYRFYLPDQNRLLRFLLADARVAEKLYAWRPIGEYVLSLLKAPADDAYLRILNRPPDRFEETCWDDPTWAGLFFFDVMVTEAAYQDVPWHMWLFYLPAIVKELAAINDDGAEGVDPNDEFPTLAARLIYAAFDMLGDWVALIGDLPEDSQQRQFKPGLDHQNSSIPKSAALALGQCLFSVLMSDNLSENFKASMLESVVHDLKGLPVGSPIRVVLAQSILNGGPLLRTGYRDMLEVAYADVDFGVRCYAPELETVLAAPPVLLF